MRTTKPSTFGRDEPPTTSWWEIDCLGNQFFSAVLEKATRDGESPDEVVRKMLIVPPAMIIFLVFSVFLVYEIIFHESSGPIRITLSTVVCMTLFAVCLSAVKRKTLPMRLVEICVAVLLVATLASDLINVGLYEQWFIAVLLMDVLLLTDPDPHLAWGLYTLTILWIILRTIEDTTRFGMYEDIPYNEEKPPRGSEGWSWGFPVIVLRCGVFGLDHALTRRFAVGMKMEKERLHRAVVMAEEVANALIRFDLVLAENLITNQNVAIKGSLLRLLENLKMYRPYLPATIFANGDDDAYCRKDDSESLNAQNLPGAVAVSPPLSPLTNTPTQPEIELEEILITEAKLKENLEVGVKSRKGSVLRAVFDTIDLDHQAAFSLASTFAEITLQEVQNWSGCVLHLNGSLLLAGWNTHIPSPRHSLNAVRCSLILGASLDAYPTLFPYKCTAIACGQVAVGSTGSSWMKSSFIWGTPVDQVVALTQLCRVIGCEQVMTEGVYEATRSQINGRLVDVIPECPRPGGGVAETINVYELCDFFPYEKAQYTEAFLAFTAGGGGGAAVRLLSDYLANSPGDLQAARMLKLAVAAEANPEYIEAPYVRRLIGWETFEQHAEAHLTEDVRELFRMSDANEMKTNEIEAEAAPRVVEKGDVLMTALRAAASKKDGFNNFKFTDLEGSVWYRSGKDLGKGSYGEVWLGMGEDGGLVAMKWLPIWHDMSDSGHTLWSDSTEGNVVENVKSESITFGVQQRERVTEVQQEVELLATLKHENIVSYLSVAVVRSSIVINMEYVPGGSLQNLIEHFGTLPLSSSRRYIKDMLRGLRYLHKVSVAHRDVKPANVLVQIDGQCKLSDFGASAALNDAMGRNVVGTLLYMAPEACRGSADTSSDIWSLGITVCQMLSGTLPYDMTHIEPHAFLYQLSRVSAEYLPKIPPLQDEDAGAFVKECLLVSERPTAEQLLVHKFMC